jgi:probable addiction module antidote protein
MIMDMGKEKFSRFDTADYLNSEEDCVAYLGAALEQGDTKLIAAALGDIARARGMAQVARDAGLGRESLYKSLSEGGNPEFMTILKVIKALGLKLVPVPAH